MQIQEQQRLTNDWILNMDTNFQTLTTRISKIHEEQKAFNQTVIAILRRNETRLTNKARSNGSASSSTAVWFFVECINSFQRASVQYPEATCPFSFASFALIHVAHFSRSSDFHSIIALSWWIFLRTIKSVSWTRLRMNERVTLPEFSSIILLPKKKIRL